MNNIKFNEEGYYVQYLDDGSFEDFNKIIRDEFKEICCGYCNCDIQEVAEIARQFLKRIKGSGRRITTNKRSIGFIGELLYYVFAKYRFPFLKEINPMLNTEENSFKKGFDMLSELDNEVWYSEVKSGEHKALSTKSINALNMQKINSAYDDLNNKLSCNNRNHNYWITAKNKLRLCLDMNDDVKRIAKLLDMDMRTIQLKNKIVVSVIFGRSLEKLDEERIIDRLSKIRENDDKVIIVCIRENTINRTLSIIKELANDE